MYRDLEIKTKFSSVYLTLNPRGLTIYGCDFDEPFSEYTRPNKYTRMYDNKASYDRAVKRYTKKAIAVK
tara:strand:+ start:330 stop:536 length:207 start_codon:yes stop_codon:yes gene_type:complete